MSYTFLDAFSSVQTAESSVVSGVVQRPIVAIGSVLSAIPVVSSGNQSVSGTIGASVIGLTPVNVTNVIQASVHGVVSINPASVSGTVGASVIGTVPVTQAGAWSASLVGVIPGSVAAFLQGNASVITAFGQSPSIVGTYGEDAGHTTADKGLFTLGVRNDNVASFASANLDYSPFGTDSAGRMVGMPFAPEESRIEGYITLTSTSVTTLVAAAGAGIKNYITDIFVANTGAATTLVTFTSGGGASVLGYTIAPAGGGSNMPGIARPLVTLANQTFGVQAATATSTLYVTVKGHKGP